MVDNALVDNEMFARDLLNIQFFGCTYSGMCTHKNKYVLVYIDVCVFTKSRKKKLNSYSIHTGMII
jgi:hypothetical protein